jgi:sugar/nucleoside kinase (ribokinase family)
LAGLFERKSWEDAAKIGNVVASRVVQSQGTMNHVFTEKEILEQVKKVY